MLTSLFKTARGFWRTRRGATAVAFAIMFVPMVIVAGAAVDFSRIASARALMQASVDGATEAGAGAYQMSENYTDAVNVTTSTMNGTATALGNFVTITQTQVGAYCATEGSEVQCGTGNDAASKSSVKGTPGPNGDGTASGTYSGNCPPTFSTSLEYCVVATMQARLTNSVFAYVLPSELLSVSSVGTTTYPPSKAGGSQIPISDNFGNAGDLSFTDAYAVPMSGDVPNYSQLASAAGCSNVYGANVLPGASAAAPSTGCAYLFLGSSDTADYKNTGGTITLAIDQPIAFTFTNETGEKGSYRQIKGTQYTTQLMVYPQNSEKNGVYQANGQTESYNTTTTQTCTTSGNTYSSCTPGGSGTNTTTSTSTSANTTNSASLSPPSTTGPTCTKSTSNGRYNESCVKKTVTITSTALYGECPDHTLYGSISSGYGTPASDYTNFYSSAYEVLGQPPTEYSNHVLTPYVTTQIESQAINNTTYYVASICPNDPTSGTKISAPALSNYSNATNGISNPSGLNIYSTWFPGQTFTDTTTAPAADSSGNALTSGTGDVFPPQLAGCAPATSATDGGVTPVADDPWWAWSVSAGNYGQCAAHQTAAYNNCALLIQPLGDAVPTNSSGTPVLPDWYLEVTDTSTGTVLAMDPIYDGTGANAGITADATTFTDLYPGVITSQLTTIDPNILVDKSNKVTDYDAAQWVPLPSSPESYTVSNITINGVAYSSVTVTVEEPANNNDNQSDTVTADYDASLPYDTSRKCYNPQDNGNLAGYVGTQQVTGDSNNGSPIDYVANPQDGAVICNQDPPESYALFWNDLGTYDEDDMGYWNAVEEFTCPVPATTNAGGGPSTLSE